MSVRAAILFASLLATLGVAQEQEPAGLPGEQVLVLELKGEIDHLTERVLSSQIEAAQSIEGLRFIVLDIDSPGGELEASKHIAFTFFNIEGVTTVAYVRRRALSGAALAALGCDLIVFAPSGQLGDILPLRIFQDFSVEVAEKQITPLRADVRALTEVNPAYPPLCAEAMVDPTISVHRVELRDVERSRVDVKWIDTEELEDLRLRRPEDVLAAEEVCAAGKLLTVTALEAQDMGFCAWTSKDLDQLLEQLQHEFSTGPLVRTVQRTPPWSHVVRFVTWWPVKSLLFVVGLVSLLFAFATPGTGLPEGLAVVCLGLVYGGSYLLGLADYIEVVLLLAGIGLLIAELFVSGFGLLGISGIACLLASLVLSYQSFVWPETGYEWATLEASAAKTLFAALLSFFGIFAAMRFLPKTRLFGGLVHQHVLPAGAGEGSASARLETVAPEGALGVALTVLRPVGKIQIGEQVLSAVADGEFVEPGDAVVVIGRRGSEAIVAHRPEATPIQGEPPADQGASA